MSSVIGQDDKLVLQIVDCNDEVISYELIDDIICRVYLSIDKTSILSQSRLVTTTDFEQITLLSQTDSTYSIPVSKEDTNLAELNANYIIEVAAKLTTGDVIKAMSLFDEYIATNITEFDE